MNKENSKSIPHKIDTFYNTTLENMEFFVIKTINTNFS